MAGKFEIVALYSPDYTTVNFRTGELRTAVVAWPEEHVGLIGLHGSTCTSIDRPWSAIWIVGPIK